MNGTEKKLNRGKILTLIHNKVSYSNIAKLFGIAKSTVAYIKKQAVDNKKTKSRLIDGTLYDFDAGVASVLLGSTTTSSEQQQVVSKKLVKAAAITFAERIGCKKFKASDGWADKFMRRNFPELKTATTGTKSTKRQNAPQMIETDGFSNPAHLQPVANIFECIVPGTVSENCFIQYM